MSLTSPKIACVGGGPGGLFLAALVKSRHPDADVTVFERKRPDDTYGFGVVFSDATLAGIHDVDPVLRTALDEHGVHWDDIEVRLKGERWSCSGNGMAAIRRATLLQLLQRHAIEAGVDIRFETAVGLDDVAGDYDLVVASDGANSAVREQLAEHFQPTYETASAKFIWFGTTYPFEGLTFVHESGPDGVFALHGYPIGDGQSTFIVETDEQTWRRAGLDEFDVSAPPGPSDLKSKEYLEKLFAEQIDGHRLLTNNSRWANFRTRRAARWHHGNVVLLGDSAHTAHFSVGSGTKMAMEDAIALATALDRHPTDIASAAAAYETLARPSVEKIQASARPSLSWWEHFGRYHDALEPWQFSFHFLTRAISAGRLERRAPAYTAGIRQRWQDAHGGAPLASPLTLNGIRLDGRTLVLGADDTVRAGDAQSPVALPLVSEPAAAGEHPWAFAVEAPDDESGLPRAVERLRRGLEFGPDSGPDIGPDIGPDLVVVRGGTRLTRTLVAEQARFVHGVPTAIVVDDLTRDDAETLVLSGRADLVAASAEHLGQWDSP